MTSPRSNEFEVVANPSTGKFYIRRFIDWAFSLNEYPSANQAAYAYYHEWPTIDWQLEEFEGWHIGYPEEEN